MRGFFGIGVEGISKPRNMGSVFRTANAFGASFVFSINAHHTVKDLNGSDTSRSYRNIPTYSWDSFDDMVLPKGCALVGVELVEGAVELPRFKHPQTAAYILGREKGSVSPEILEKCQHIIKIPTEFCINVALAGSLVMYDRLLSLGRFGDRAVVPSGAQPLPEGLKWAPIPDPVKR